MSILCCFTSLVGRNKKDKGEKGNKTMQVRVQHLGKPIDTDELKSNSTFSVDVPFSMPKSSTCNVKLMIHQSPVKDEQEEEEEEEEKDFQQQEQSRNISLDVEISNDGHLSDPGASKTPFLASPKLKRSCSNLETTRSLWKYKIAPSKCESFEDLQKLGDGFSSPASVRSHCSADKVILRKCSSSQILPSKSRRLWWKLFLWSHRNLHEPAIGIQNKLLFINQQGGYSSDTLEPNRRAQKPRSKSNSRRFEKVNVFDGGSGLWPQNQWVAFSAGSPLTRVDEWVQEIPTEPPVNEEEESEITFPPSPENGKIRNMNLPEEIAHANRVIQSLNSSSTVAHISGIGLKVIPAISGFSSLRSVNLSGNSIVHIIAGSLPKGLHTLDLSRNKIDAIQGLRELNRLRILDLSYNRISRIGQGLSSCTLIKELYLAGNKISNVEGLHRLLKLITLDLSFNKIATSKALGQLVANYNSLQALNLLGNPIQSNISDDQIRKTLCGLLPKLVYLNKQLVNPQKARQVAKEAVTKAALGNARRRSAKKRHPSGRHALKPRSHHRSTKPSAFTS